MPLLSLLATTDVIYYDLYLYYDGVQSTTPLDQITSGALYPVPVLLKNLRNGGAAFNANPETFDDQLTRRFFTVDALSGVSQAGQLPAVVRYLKTARLTATIRSDDAIPSQILPPLLEIEYAEVALAVDGTALDAQAALLSSGVEITTSFLVRHTMQMDNSNAAINNFFVIALVVWVLGTIAAGIIMVRRSRGAFEGYHRLVAQACNVFATVCMHAHVRAHMHAHHRLVAQACNVFATVTGCDRTHQPWAPCGPPALGPVWPTSPGPRVAHQPWAPCDPPALGPVWPLGPMRPPGLACLLGGSACGYIHPCTQHVHAYARRSSSRCCTAWPHGGSACTRASRRSTFSCPWRPSRTELVRLESTCTWG